MLEVFKSQRHDFNHYLGCIYGLMRLKKYDEMEKYIQDITNQASEFNLIVNIKNPIIMSLLNIKLAKAKNANIEVDLSINIQDDIKIESIDLSSIIGNLLENAIEACTKLPENERKIGIEILNKNENLVIKITNTKENKSIDTRKIIEQRYTTKGDKENHGYGLINVRNIIEKYNGLIKIESENDYFKVNIALPNRK